MELHRHEIVFCNRFCPLAFGISDRTIYQTRSRQPNDRTTSSGYYSPQALKNST
ncbi:MAG: hypothetical protein QNJ55_26345 [Xenococcus sp. MO_188.B8]|nr:hypothetical protein [Xenococcus sp. MO_188.B8]